MKKILFLLPKTEQGGAETQMIYLMKNLDPRRYKVALGTLYPKTITNREFESIENIQIVDFGKRSWWDLGIYFRIAKFLKKNNIDIIHTFLGNHHAYLPAVIAGKKIAIGGIRSSYQPLTLVETALEILLPSMLLKHCQYFLVSNSHAGKRAYIESRYPSKAISVIPNGIALERFATGNGSKIREELSLGKTIVIGTISRLIEGKNLEGVIAMFESLHSRHANIRLLIVGGGPQKENLNKILKEKHLEDKVFLTDNRKDIPDILHSMDIFVFPTLLPEGWPNVVGEAMAAGLPVVAFKSGDISRIIDRPKQGIVLPRGDAMQFIQKVEQLIMNQKLRKNIGREAKNKIQKYSIMSMVHAYEKLYERWLGNDRK